MKKFLFLLLALVLSVSVSCSDDKTGDTGGSMLSVTPTEIEFEAAGGSRLLDLRTDAGAWSLTQSDNTAWCTPGPHIGQNLHGRSRSRRPQTSRRNAPRR